MKTKKAFLVAATIVLSSYCFSQEVSETYQGLQLLTQKDNEMDRAAMPALVQKRAAFNSTAKYQSLQQFLNQNIQFPNDAKSLGVSGPVIAHFEIRWDGSLGKIYFVTSPDQLFSNEVERVLRMAPPFIPAIIEGQITSSYEQIKINFSLK